LLDGLIPIALLCHLFNKLRSDDSFCGDVVSSHVFGWYVYDFYLFIVNLFTYPKVLGINVLCPYGSTFAFFA